MKNQQDKNKWPKTIAPLSPEQEIISDDFVKYFHEVLSNKLSFYNKFNHRYVVKNSPYLFLTSLEIGAGDGEHLDFESLSKIQRENYIATDIRENMLFTLKKNHPDIQTRIEDCSNHIGFPDDYFDRVIAIHVLEHIPNLPSAVKEIYRVCNKQTGIFSVVIPCEGSFLHNIGRKISAERIFKKRYKQSYDWFIKREHLNIPAEVIEELSKYFYINSTEYYPFKIKMEFCNLCIGLTLSPKKVLND